MLTKVSYYNCRGKIGVSSFQKQETKMSISVIMYLSNIVLDSGSTEHVIYTPSKTKDITRFH
jgi:hypothetical protein